ncbi:Gfo/Idh/MocA family protein [Acuticoccus mangrovi]|uniref:Gfo/Idh/MocA family oxidoreductase n=1 Tax=Acuticoccus mangrovi TaxID=2796142 RepID=A0A934IR11_9HYPH|nr:Gfo/Idh/MocA family oxidoreductase [Acuticoccus mangrovi]MBJ3776049.1 Gfo/Idh/MocA family oxidoreductase [Acuticoccus mangrovi]
MGKIAIVGAGFVADAYLRAASHFPDHRFSAVWDGDPERLSRFAAHWNVPIARGVDDLFTGPKRPHLLLNLAPLEARAAITREALGAGIPVYCEAPLAADIGEAANLRDYAAQHNLALATTPASLLGETAQAAWSAVRRRQIGKPHLAVAELHHGYLAQAPFRDWTSESGAPWPAREAFGVGAPLWGGTDHLAWLLAIFGPVRSLVASTACLVPDKLGDGAPNGPDFATATLHFDDGIVARLTASMVARKAETLRIVGTRGTLTVDGTTGAVRIARRNTVRHQLVEGLASETVHIMGPARRRFGLRLGGAGHNLMTGPAELLDAMDEARPARLAADFAFHLTEVLVTIADAGPEGRTQDITSTFEPPAPMPWARPYRRRESTVDTIKLGIVGTGAAAREMREAILSEPHFELVAVAGETIDLAEAFAGENELERAYGSVADLLASEIDAVVVAGAPATRAAAIVAALAAGKPVLAASPFAVSAAEARRVLDTARDKGVLFMEALAAPFLPAHKRAVEIAHSGDIGDVVHFSLDHGAPASAETAPALFAPDGGGVVLNGLAAPLALAITLFGEVSEIDEAIASDDRVDVHASLQVRHAGGGISQLSASLTTMMSNTARIAGTRGAVRIEEPVLAAETLSVRKLPPAAAAAPEPPPAGGTAPAIGAGTKEQIAARLKRSGVMRRMSRAVSHPRHETHGYGAAPESAMLAHFASLVTDKKAESDVLPLDLLAALQAILFDLRPAPSAPPVPMPAPPAEVYDPDAWERRGPPAASRPGPPPATSEAFEEDDDEDDEDHEGGDEDAPKSADRSQPDG